MIIGVFKSLRRPYRVYTLKFKYPRQVTKYLRRNPACVLLNSKEVYNEHLLQKRVATNSR